jgi:hypothetical protein
MTDRVEKYKELLDKGLSHRDAYILTDENPLSTYERLEKIRESKKKESKSEDN